MHRRPHYRTLMILFLVVFLLNGCGPAPAAPATPTTEPTATIAPTQTPLPTETPKPTSTPTEAPTLTATPDKTATVVAEIAATEQAQAALVEPDLLEYGLDPKEGHVAWINPETLNLEATGYEEEFVHVLKELGEVADFVLKTTVRWNSSGGLAGCAVTFRAEDDLKQGAHYSLYLMRLQFMPVWDIEYHKFNRWEATTNVGGKALPTDQLNDDKNSENVITLIARGENFTTYFNGEKQSAASHNKLKDGNIAFMAWQNSGKTTCKYSDTWVWVFDQ